MDFINHNSLSSLCRSCLENGGNICLFDKVDHLNDSFSEMLLACTSIVVLPGDYGPQGLCNKCIFRLKDAYMFRRQCQESEARLKKLITLKSEIKSDEVLVNFVDCNEDIETPDCQYSDIEDKAKSVTKYKTEDSGNTLIKKKESYLCEVCTYSTNKKHHLISHIKCHTGEKSYSCDTCSKRFASKLRLVVHIKKCANGSVCDVCGKVYKRLQLHRLTHSTQKAHQCVMCAAAFSSKHQLTQHVKWHNKGNRVRKHTCNTCSKSFFDARSLSDHTKIHESVRELHSCSICQKNFVGRSGLTAHMTRHTIIKKFKCDHCSKAFHSKADLASHMITHLGKKSFECEQCGKSFVRKNSLATHKISHAKTKNYVCNICNQRFARNNSLYDHKKKKHNIKSSRSIEPAYSLDLTATAI